MADLNKLATDLQVLKNEVEQVASVNTKLDSAIDKLTDVTNCLNRMIAVQEQKLDQQEQDDNYLKEVITKIDRRVSAIERWKWLVIGGALVVGFAIAKYSVITQIIS